MNFNRAEDLEVQRGATKNNDGGGGHAQSSWRGTSSADPNPLQLTSVPALREQLMSRDHELKVARHELSYMSSLISTLRGEIMRADEEKSLASASAKAASGSGDA